MLKIRASLVISLTFLIQNSTFSLVVVFQQLIIHLIFLKLRSAQKIVDLSVEIFLTTILNFDEHKNLPKSVIMYLCYLIWSLNWLSVELISNVNYLIYAFSLPVIHKAKKKECTHDLQRNEYTCDLQCTWAPYPLPLGHVACTISTAIGAMCMYISSFITIFTLHFEVATVSENFCSQPKQTFGLYHTKQESWFILEYAIYSVKLRPLLACLRSIAIIYSL